MIEINSTTYIDEERLEFVFSRSSGPGGQNVNKVNTRVTLRLDIVNCPDLTDVQKRRILRHLANRIDKDGVLQIHCQQHRSQAANRMEAIEILKKLLSEAIYVQPKRKKTKIPQAVHRKRLKRKKERGEIKKGRSWKPEI